MISRLHLNLFYWVKAIDDSRKCRKRWFGSFNTKLMKRFEGNSCRVFSFLFDCFQHLVERFDRALGNRVECSETRSSSLNGCYLFGSLLDIPLSLKIGTIDWTAVTLYFTVSWRWLWFLITFCMEVFSWWAMNPIQLFG